MFDLKRKRLIRIEVYIFFIALFVAVILNGANFAYILLYGEGIIHVNGHDSTFSVFLISIYVIASLVYFIVGIGLVKVMAKILLKKRENKKKR